MSNPTERPAGGDGDHARAIRYVRAKVDQLLEVMGTSPLRPEELDDATLLELDPIGIVAESFRRVLEHLHRTNERLAFAHGELQAVFDSAGLGILVIDRRHRIVACNAELRRQFGSPEKCPVGEECSAMICGFENPVSACPFGAVFRTGEPLVQKSWRIGGRVYDVVATPVRDSSGVVANVVLVYADLTERVQAEEALRVSEEKYRDLFENANDLIVCFRLDGSIEYVNQAFHRTLGFGPGELEAASVFDLLHPDCVNDCRAKIDELLAGRKEGTVRAIFRSRAGGRVVVEGDVRLVRAEERPVAIRGILRDVTEREALAEELLRREKLESIGLLAGGIAHDFNNILTAVLGNISLALALVPEGGRVGERLIEAERAASSARELTQQLLTFAKGGVPVRSIVSLADLLRDHAAFACRGANVGVDLDLPPDLWPADVDAGQIGQVVHNLVLNAVQSMPDGGRVRIEASNVTAGPDGAGFLAPGRYVRFSVADTGVGIPRENLQRMFDPYFTTKKGGSGLGLAVTYSIVKKHEGHIQVDSEPGRGSKFTVWVPASSEPAPEPAAEVAPGIARGRGRILVMDDERFVRDTTSQMLGELGYEVDLASDGEEAVRLCREAVDAGRGYDLLLVDLTVPGGMGGREAFGLIRQFFPGVRALVSSGYSSDPVMASYREYGFCGVLVKPYRLADLAAAVERGVRGGRGPSSR